MSNFWTRATFERKREQKRVTLRQEYAPLLLADDRGKGSRDGDSRELSLMLYRWMLFSRAFQVTCTICTIRKINYA